jgi:hypothetical protein
VTSVSLDEANVLKMLRDLTCDGEADVSASAAVDYIAVEFARWYTGDIDMISLRQDMREKVRAIVLDLSKSEHVMLQDSARGRHLVREDGDPPDDPFAWARLSLTRKGLLKVHADTIVSQFITVSTDDEPDDGIGLIFATIYELLQRDAFDVVDLILSDVSLDTLPIVHQLAMLSITNPAREKLDQRAAFARRVRKRIMMDDDARVDELLRGLE